MGLGYVYSVIIGHGVHGSRGAGNSDEMIINMQHQGVQSSAQAWVPI